MQRIEIFKLLYATNDILGKPEIKSSLNAKQIYSISKLNNKLSSINKATGVRQDELRAAFGISVNGLNKELSKEDKESQMKSLQESFNEDMKAILEDEVENPVEVKIPFEASEKILQNLDKSDVTQAVIEHLIAEPLPELKVV